MNDFTKEELQEIQSALSIFSGSPRGNSLFYKIQTMIDNYCEHETSAEKPCEHQHDGLLYASHPPQSKCRLCGEFYRAHSFKDEMEVK